MLIGTIFSYLLFGPAISLVVINLASQVRRESSGGSSIFAKSKVLQYADAFVVALRAYFLPNKYWSNPFWYVGVMQNLTVATDVWIFLLKLLERLGSGGTRENLRKEFTTPEY